MTSSAQEERTGMTTPGPCRVQLKRTKGWKMPPNTVKVTRPGIWGNPFIHKNAAVAVEAYRRLISGGTQSFEMGPGKLQFAKNCHPSTLHWAYADFVKTYKHQLRGKNLACWCRLDQPCHADVLLEISNRDAARAVLGETQK